jgi:hypothetical protein
LPNVGAELFRTYALSTLGAMSRYVIILDSGFWILDSFQYKTWASSGAAVKSQPQA